MGKGRGQDKIDGKKVRAKMKLLEKGSELIRKGRGQNLIHREWGQGQNGIDTKRSEVKMEFIEKREEPKRNSR